MLKVQRPSGAGSKPGSRLRDHATWPPAWGSSYKGMEKFPIAEEGVLKAVELVPADPRDPERLRLTIEYEGKEFTGILLVRDPSLTQRVRDQLQALRGRSIRGLGDLEVE